MKLLSLVAASSILLAATAAASTKHHRVHHSGASPAYAAYGIYRAYPAYGTYGAYPAYGPYGAFAAGNRGYGFSCRVRRNERPEILTQDVLYEENDVGTPC
jgi:hypothetical protein